VRAGRNAVPFAINGDIADVLGWVSIMVGSDNVDRRRALAATAGAIGVAALGFGPPAAAQDGFQGVRPSPAPRVRTNAAPAPPPQEVPRHWLLGRWEGDIANMSNPMFGSHRMLRVTSVAGPAQAMGEWLSGTRTAASIAVITIDGDVVRFTTSTGAILTLRRVGENRLQGSFIVQDSAMRGSYPIILDRIAD
jgi:hypothetical protein